MALKRLLALAVGRAPYAHCSVVAPRCQQLAVRAPGHRPYPVTANYVAEVTVSYALCPVTALGLLGLLYVTQGRGFTSTVATQTVEVKPSPVTGYWT